MPEPRKITIKDITKDDLDATYPRVTAKIVDDNDKELTLTIFKKKAKEQDDGTTTPEIIPQKGHSYMGFFKKPKEGFHMGSFNIAWEVHSEPTEDTQEPIAEPIKDEEPAEPPYTPPAPKRTGERDIIDESETPPEPETPKEPLVYTVPEIITETRLRVAEIEARRENRLTRNIPLTEFIDNCQRIIKYVETGE